MLDGERPFDLMLGDEAPALHADEWLAGEATAIEPGRVTLLYFWATWSPPSLLGFAEMSLLQDENRDKGLVVVGITREDDRGSRLFSAKETVSQNEAFIRHSLAWDAAGVNWERYMTASGHHKIPHVILVDRSGRIAFMGHPGELDDPLEQVLAGTFDLQAAATEYAERLMLAETKREIEKRLSEAYRSRRFGEVLLAMDELIALSPDYRNFAVNKFHLMLREMQDVEGAYAWAREAAETCLAEDWYALNTIAYSIVIAKNLQPKDFDVALELAEKATSIEGGDNGTVWNTVGAVRHARGELPLAITAMEKAVELTEQPGQKQAYVRTLESYRKQQQ